MEIKHNIPEYGVSEFNKIFRDILESNFNYVRIRGEISEVKSAAKGQLYITIKDKNSIISAVIWESKLKYLKLQPEIGMEIIATGKITTWFRYKTTYQLDIDNLEVSGVGTLLQLIEERKKRLAAKGVFDKKNKKTIPFLPNKIGIITSPTGSVIHDIINRLKERFPVNVDLWPTSVQGIEASNLIIKAIKGFNDKNYQKKPDVIIIARGGGSVEDLMVFNDEKLVMAVFESKIPIISAIGHETDTTILDFVSDLRVPTPSAAAEKVVPVRKELIHQVSICSNRLFNSIDSRVKYFDGLISNLTRLLKDPKFILDKYKEYVLAYSKELSNSYKILFEKKFNMLHTCFLRLKSPEEILKLKKVQSKNIFKNLELQILQIINLNSFSLKNLKRLLNSNSIDFNLKKGFVILKKSNKIIKRSDQLRKHNNLQIKFYDKLVDIKIEKN